MTGRVAPGVLEVERADALVLVQDLGRPGWGHLGVPPSGALDPDALRLANRLVGNREDAAGLEVLLGGLAVRPASSIRIALVGAGLPLFVDGRAAPWGESISVPEGAIVEVRRGGSGLRCWLAVSGGVITPQLLGSRSTCTLSGLGPPPLAAGDLLPLGPAPRRPPSASSAPGPHVGSGTVELRLELGPRDGWFTAESLAGLWDRDLHVTPSSDRVALRLDGDVELVRRTAGELPSEGIVTGAVQVPGGGRPLLFLADRPTTGGYPVIGVVRRSDLPRCAQLRPGDAVRLLPSHR